MATNAFQQSTNNIAYNQTNVYIHQPEDLNKHKPIDLYLTSNYDGFNEATEDLFSKLEVSGHSSLIKRCLHFLLVNLTYHYLHNPRHVMSIKRDSNWWSNINRTNTAGKRENNPSNISRKVLDVLDALTSLGYIEQRIGYYLPEQHTGKTTKVIILPLFITEVIQVFSLHTATFYRNANTALIKLNRNGQGYSKYIESTNTLRMKESLEAYNTLLASSNISSPHPMALRQEHKTVHRVFNSNFYQGGRFYGPFWQSYSKTKRGTITINGGETVELDYEAQHILLAYASARAPYQTATLGDPYHLDSYPRDLIKKIMLLSFNTDTAMKAWQAARLQYRKNNNTELLRYIDLYQQYQAIMDGIKEKHSEIAHLFHTNMGLKLQYRDSLICEYIIETLTNENIPVLTIHDSFIVDIQNANELRQVMKDAYTHNGLEQWIPNIR